MGTRGAYYPLEESGSCGHVDHILSCEETGKPARPNRIRDCRRVRPAPGREVRRQTHLPDPRLRASQVPGGARAPRSARPTVVRSSCPGQGHRSAQRRHDRPARPRPSTPGPPPSGARPPIVPRRSRLRRAPPRPRRAAACIRPPAPYDPAHQAASARSSASGCHPARPPSNRLSAMSRHGFSLRPAPLSLRPASVPDRNSHATAPQRTQARSVEREQIRLRSE